MSSATIYPFGVDYRVPRPRGENSLAGLIFGAILGLGLTENPMGALAGGAIGGALANQPLPLEAAIRAYFGKMNLPVVGFYRLGPRAAKVLFRYREQFWTIMSRAPESSNWTSEMLDDWLYGDIVEKQLPIRLRNIDAHLG